MLFMNEYCSRKPNMQFHFWRSKNVGT
jgi:hypothetical protein